MDHDRREVFNGSRMGKEFSANVFNDLAKWWDGIPRQEKESFSGPELWKRYGHSVEDGSALEQAAGIFSMDTNPAVDYEEEAFRRRMKRKRNRRNASRAASDTTIITPGDHVPLKCYFTMQQEDDLRALAKIMEFGRAVSIFILVVHVYVYCYPSMAAWYLNLEVIDRILMNFERTTGIFGCILWTKLLAVLLLAISCVGTIGVKGKRLPGNVSGWS